MEVDSGGVSEGVADSSKIKSDYSRPATSPCSDDNDSDCQIVSIYSPIVIEGDSSDNASAIDIDQLSSDEDDFVVET